MQQKNHYITLGVATTASFEAIKAAYRLLAKKYHPDKNSGNKAAEEHFKEIQQAYAVLSNPEKRKKYDLKILYGAPYTRQKPNMQYNGKAYQYAQQQAQQQTQQKRQGHSQPKTQTKYNKTENHQVLVSIGIAFILLYFIVSFNAGQRGETDMELKEETADSINKFQNKLSRQLTTNENPAALTLEDFDSPYRSFFGTEIADQKNSNNITIHNSSQSEAIVCLVENKNPQKTIRNNYLDAGSDFKIENIPDGEYFLKVYYGKNWDAAKTFVNNKVKGGFKNEIGFIELKTGKEILKMKQKESASGTSFSSYNISIDPQQKTEVKTITAEEFFK